jgi:hypothetical protein
MPKYKVKRKFFNKGRTFEVGEEQEFSVSFGQGMGPVFLEEIVVKTAPTKKEEPTSNIPESNDGDVVITKEKAKPKRAPRKPKAKTEDKA